VAMNNNVDGRWFRRSANEDQPDVYYEHGRDGYQTTNIIIGIV